MALNVPGRTIRQDSEISISKLYSQGHFVTLTRFLLSEQQRFSAATGEFSQLISVLQTVVKTIAAAVKRFGIGFSLVQQSVKQEETKRLLIFCNELFVNLLSSSYSTCILSSELTESTVIVEPGRQGKYAVVFTPLDGIDNVGVFGTMGSIFGVLTRSGKLTGREILQPGKSFVCAGYAIYGSSTSLIITLGENSGVNGFTLDPAVGEFILTDNNIKIPTSGHCYCINEGVSSLWEPAVIKYVKMKKDVKAKKTYTSRYTGCSVADVHRILKTGGIYMYPANKELPTGKLRLVHHCNPLAFIVTEAGGRATTGKQPVLEIVPEKLGQRTPIFMGSRDEVNLLLEQYDVKPSKF